MKSRRQLVSLLSASSLLSSADAFSSSSPLPRHHRHPHADDAATATELRATPRLKKKEHMRTLQRFLEVECWKLPHLKSMDRTLNAAADACKQINRIVQRAKTDDLYGAAVDPVTGEPLEENVQGEVQQQLDVLCNTYMLRAFCGGSDGAIIAVASEEEDEPFRIFQARINCISCFLSCRKLGEWSYFRVSYCRCCCQWKRINRIMGNFVRFCCYKGRGY